MSDSGAPVWVLLGRRTGDNNQLLRLAGELGVPMREVRLEYNRGALLPPALLGATLRTLKADSRAQIVPPWPRLVLGIGYRSVPVAMAIRQLSGGTTKLVRLGNPRLDSSNFDLVITTAQYPVPPAANVIRLPLGISTAPTLEPSNAERSLLEPLARPHRLLLIGGDTFMWTLKPASIAEAARKIAAKQGGSVIAVSSPRSDRRVLNAVEAALKGSSHALVWGRSPRYPVLLRDADEIYVTADSVAMVSDAIATGRPVALIEPQKTAAGRLLYELARATGRAVPIRDISAFVTSVRAQGLAGSVADPIAGDLPLDPLQTAVDSVRSLEPSLFEA